MPRKRRSDRRPCLLIDVCAVFNGEHVQPLGADTAVENMIGPDLVVPDLLLLKVTFQRLVRETCLTDLSSEHRDLAAV